MSHLLKSNRINLKILRITFYFIILIPIFMTTFSYDGNKFIIFIYALLLNCIFFFVLNKKAYFFEIFFGGLLWLGFWYKFFIIVVFENYQFREGPGLYNQYDFINKIQIIDNSLVTVCYGISGFLIACLIKNTFLKKFYNLKEKFKTTNNSINIKILVFFILIFIIVFSIITLSNFYLGIYQRGILATYNVHFIISAIYKWLLLFGFTSFIAFCFIFTINKTSKIYLISAAAIIETFFSNLSFLSRGMIFNCFSIFIGLYKSNNFYKLKLNFKFFLIYLFSILCFFYLSVISVNYLRANIFFVKLDPLKTIDIKQDDKEIKKKEAELVKKFDTPRSAFLEFLEISKTRWVGIDALVAVEAFQGKSFDFLKNSFGDKFDKDKYPYYERNIQKRVKKLHNTIQYGITTPGIVAFLYYSGSNTFVFLTIFLISFLILTFEKIIFHIFNNLIICSILSQVVAYRLIHFGYMPQNTYMLLTSVLITILGLFLVKKILKLK